jgi:lysyl-tRNA synthetase class 2
MTKATTKKPAQTGAFTQKNGKDFDSSMVKSYTYNPDDETLEVTFTNKASYRYSEVEQKTADALVEAESKGTFINEEVKGSHPYEKLS